jgi:hypothetical protein
MRTRAGTLLLVSMLACCVAGRARAQQLPTFPVLDAAAPRRSTEDDDVADDAGFVRFEYLCWWMKDAPLPAPLVTSGTPSGRGIIGALGTSVLAGAGQQSFGGLSGGRLRWLEWTDSEGDYGVEVGIFYFEHHAVHFQESAAASGNSVLAIPFIDVSSGSPQASSLVLAQPGVSSGTAALVNGTQLWGGDFNFALNLDDWLGDTSTNVRLLTGLNTVDLNESLQLITDSTSASGAAHHSDIFAARSNFLGIDLAAVVGQRWRRAYFELIPKFSIGANVTTDYIAAQDVSPALFSVNAPRVVYNSHEGTFAQPSNIGHYWPTFFSVMPQLQARTTYRLCSHCSLTMAYDGLFWTNVLRPGGMIDPQINPTQITGNLVGQRQPVRAFNTGNFWAQGFSGGLQVSF